MFSLKQEIGLNELLKGYQLEDSVRRVLCAMVLLGYHLMIVYVLGNTEGDLVQAAAILDDQLKVIFPAFFFCVLTMLETKLPSRISKSPSKAGQHKQFQSTEMKWLLMLFDCRPIPMVCGSCSSKGDWNWFRETSPKPLVGTRNRGSRRTYGRNSTTFVTGS